jgi:hypothetical protein
MLLVIGLGVFTYKYHWLHLPLTPDKTSNIWDIEIRISFNAKNNSSSVKLFIPGESRKFTISSEYFHSGKFGLVTEKKGANRQANWSIRKAKGKQNLYYRAVIQKLEGKQQQGQGLSKPGPVEPPVLEELYLNAARTLWNEVYERSADLDSIIGHLFKLLNQPAGNENVILLLGEYRSSTNRKIEITTQLLALAGIPARAVHGFDLSNERREVKMTHWLEVYYQKKWWSYEPGKGSADLPESTIAWWRGPSPLYRVKGGDDSKVNISAQKIEQETTLSRLSQRERNSSGFLKFSLLNLPIQNQNVYRMMLLIPLGALLVVLFRNFIGINTFGTFMPVLIALAFRETQLIWGVVFFSMVVALGLGVRLYLENLKLLVVPRLSAVLIAVIIIIAVLNVLTHNLGLSLGLSVSLFPIVIISMTIERMSILWEERGAAEAIKQGLGTLFVSIMTYPLLRNQNIEHIFFFFPELLLVLLALIILAGRYSGFRLLELYRFRELIREKK